MATAILLRTPLPPLPPRGLRQRRYQVTPSAVLAGREPAARTTGPTMPWATCAVQIGRVGTMDVGRALLCSWATRGFGPATVELFFYFLNIFKSLQIQKSV
jgi:hypothetical protein